METKKKYKSFKNEFDYISEPSKAWKNIKPSTLKYFGSIANINNIGLLRELYVPVKSRQYDRSILASTLLEVSPTDIEHFEKNNSFPIDNFSAFFHNNDKLLFMLIISSIGKGKTTFLHHQLFIDLPRIFPDVAWKPIIIDVTKVETNNDDILCEVKEEIDMTITKSYKCFHAQNANDIDCVHNTLCNIFKDELMNKRIKDLPENREKQECFLNTIEFKKYQRKRLEYAKKTQPNVYIILAIDNLDQHLPYLNRSQLIADLYGISANVGIPLIITLRDTSFRINNPHMILSSYELADYICLEEVDNAEMLSLRFRKIYEAMEKKNEDKSTIQFIKILEKQFSPVQTGKPQSHFLDTFPWIEGVSNHNKRYVLQIVKKAIESKLITQIGHERDRFVVEREFFNDGIHVKKLKRALLISGINNYFGGDNSNVNFINLFDCNVPSWDANWLFRVKLLQYYQKNNDGIFLNDLVEKFLDVLGDDQNNKNIILENIRIFVEKGLISIRIRSTDDPSIMLMNAPVDMSLYLNHKTFLTHNGLFHIETLIFDDLYLDEMKFATWIHRNIFSVIFENYKSGQQPFRVYRSISTKKFIQYILEKEDELSYIDNGLDTAPIFENIYSKYTDVSSLYDKFVEKRKEKKLNK